MDVFKKDKEYIAGTYKRYDVAIESGRGAAFVGTDGKKYIDFCSGIGVLSLGSCDEEWCEAVCAQTKKLAHTGNYFYTEPAAALARKLCDYSGMKKVFFSNSGAEANECAIKAARKSSFDKYGEGRSNIITIKGSFHGRTITTVSATGQEEFHKFFFPFTEGFRFAEPEEIETIKEICDESVCAIMLEGIQGEGGVIPLHYDFVRAVTHYAKENDILIIFDEVQTGIGRTGYLFAFQYFDIEPDIVSLAKGLGGGLPIGATLLGKKVEKTLSPGTHGSTFGGNPIVCAGANVVLNRIAQREFLARVKKCGQKIKDKVSEVGSDKIVEIRGGGLMIGLELCEGISAREIAEKLLAKGVAVLTAGRNTVRIMPPLNISDEELDAGLKILCEGIKEI